MTDSVFEQLAQRHDELMTAHAQLLDRLNPVMQWRPLRANTPPLTRATDGAGGWDLVAADAVTLAPGERALLHTGIAVAIPEGWVGLIWPRSGLAVDQGLDRLAGVVDSDYRGEVRVAVINRGLDLIRLESNERCAQLVVVPCLIDAEESQSLAPSGRGNGGFGSSGSF
ncbi:dUTP diphosphatase [Halomonas sp. NO4]|uniref:dUTP diphosphatase n=1 Tax=Halomonas sp. NO4 TaxID=2484813 RepID=UPI00196A0D85|nr:dUTP diphosphatase [Halomonas sp. NO4]